MAGLSTANDKNPYNSVNSYKSYADAVAGARAAGIEAQIYQSSGGTWHWQPQYQAGGQPVSQDTYNSLYNTGSGGGTTQTGGTGGGKTTPFDTAKNEGWFNGVLYRDHNEYLKASGGAGGGGPQSADSVLADISKQITDSFQKFTDRANQFDANNPFTFDEAAAKASASERYNPYYNSELSDFMKGIDVQRSNAQGDRSLLTDLNTIQTSQDQTKLNETIKASEEGFAGAGLFFSGARLGATGQANIAGNQQDTARTATFNNNLLHSDNTLNSITNNQNTGVRQIGAAQTTDIESEVARLKAEAEARRATEKNAYIGYPGSSSGLVNTLLGSFQA